MNTTLSETFQMDLTLNTTDFQAGLREAQDRLETFGSKVQAATSPFGRLRQEQPYLAATMQALGGINRQTQEVLTHAQQATHSIAQAIGGITRVMVTGIAAALTSLIFHAKSVREILQGLLQTIVQILLEAFLKILLFRTVTGIFGGALGLGGILPHFAEGGVVPGVYGEAVPVVAHAGEVVLNAAQQRTLADTLHSSKTTGRGTPPVVNIHIAAIDGPSIERLVTSPTFQRTLVRTLDGPYPVRAATVKLKQ